MTLSCIVCHSYQSISMWVSTLLTILVKLFRIYSWIFIHDCMLWLWISWLYCRGIDCTTSDSELFFNLKSKFNTYNLKTSSTFKIFNSICVLYLLGVNSFNTFCFVIWWFFHMCNARPVFQMLNEKVLMSYILKYLHCLEDYL